MSRAAKCAIAVGTIAFVLIAIAFWIKPRACEGGLEIYFFCGLAALLAMAALPFSFGIGKSVLARVASALGLVVLGIAAWLAGLVLANVQLLCRLFQPIIVQMGPEAKLEAKVVRELAKLLADEQRHVGRWRTAANIAIFLGCVLLVIAIFGYLQDAGGSWFLAVLSGIGGLCLGLGLWFTTFVEQWPVVRPYIDADKVRRRATEIERR